MTVNDILTFINMENVDIMDYDIKIPSNFGMDTVGRIEIDHDDNTVTLIPRC